MGRVVRVGSEKIGGQGGFDAFCIVFSGGAIGLIALGYVVGNGNGRQNTNNSDDNHHFDEAKPFWGCFCGIGLCFVEPMLNQITERGANGPSLLLLEEECASGAIVHPSKHIP